MSKRVKIGACSQRVNNRFREALISARRRVTSVNKMGNSPLDHTVCEIHVGGVYCRHYRSSFVTIVGWTFIATIYRMFFRHVGETRYTGSRQRTCWARDSRACANCAARYVAMRRDTMCVAEIWLAGHAPGIVSRVGSIVVAANAGACVIACARVRMSAHVRMIARATLV